MDGPLKGPIYFESSSICHSGRVFRVLDLKSEDHRFKSLSDH